MNNPFRKLTKPSHSSLSQESLDALPNYPQPQNSKGLSEQRSSVTDTDSDAPVKRTTKPCYLSLSQEPRDLLRAKLKQAKSMSNLALYNRSQAMRVSPSSSPKSSPNISRTSLHPNDALSVYQNRNETRARLPVPEEFIRDLDPVYHTIHAGMRPPKYFMDWEHKLQCRGNREAENTGNFSEANSDDMEYMDSRSYFEGEESQDEDTFYSHVIPSTSPQDQENVAYRFERNTEDFIDEEGNLQMNPILGRTLDRTVKAEYLYQYPAITREQEDLQTQHNKPLKLMTSAAEQTQRTEDAARKYEDEFISQLFYSGENQVIPPGGRFENCSYPNLDGRTKNERPTRYVSGNRSRERDLYQQTTVMDSESEEELFIPQSSINTDEGFRLLIRRQQLERDALMQKHRDEIEEFRHQQLIKQLSMNNNKFQPHQQTYQMASSSSSPTVSTQAAAAVYPVVYQPVTSSYSVTAPRAPGTSLEDYLMYSTAPQSPTFEASGGPSLPNTPPPYVPHPINGQPHSITSEEALQRSGGTNPVLTRPVVINAANGQQFVSNHLGMVNPNQTVMGYNPTMFHHGNGHVSPNSVINGCLGTEAGNIVTVRSDIGQMPAPPGAIHYPDPLWVPISSANQANPNMIPNSTQCFNQYPVGSLGGLPGFRRVSTATGSLLQLAHGPPPQLAPTVGTPGYYFQPAVTPLLQAGMRFVYETQQRQDGAASPTLLPSTPLNSVGTGSLSDRHLAGHRERFHGRLGSQAEHN